MIRVFMSYGMNGKTEDDMRAARRRLRRRVEAYFNSTDRGEKYETIYTHSTGKRPQERVMHDLYHMNPMKYVRLVDNHKCKGADKDGKLYYLGEALKEMDKCDAIIFDDDYKDYRGCVLERHAAKEYGLFIIE